MAKPKTSVMLIREVSYGIHQILIPLELKKEEQLQKHLNLASW